MKEFLRNNPVFWSRLGFAYDPPLRDENGELIVFNSSLEKYGNYHRSFSKIGVNLHTCILPSGWVGVNEYDYSLTDKVMDEVFRNNDDIYFIRISGRQLQIYQKFYFSAKSPFVLF